jgi:hypothetical protein
MCHLSGAQTEHLVEIYHRLLAAAAGRLSGAGKEKQRLTDHRSERELPMKAQTSGDVNGHGRARAHQNLASGALIGVGFAVAFA